MPIVNHMSKTSSRLVFGTGGRFGRLEANLAQKLVDHAWSLGVRSFDTGFYYSGGRSQKLLSQCLLKYASSESLFISTKVKAEPATISTVIDLCRSIFCKSNLDIVFLWGPSVNDLNNPILASYLASALESGAVTRFGVNTHDLSVMNSLTRSCCYPFITDVMIDYSLAQRDRESFISHFYSAGLKVWAGTALAQGYLIESVWEQFLRTRSISYILRACLNKPTRSLLNASRPLRNMLRSQFYNVSRELPLAYVLSNPSISYIPIGMMSCSSLEANVRVERKILSYAGDLSRLSRQLSLHGSCASSQ